LFYYLQAPLRIEISTQSDLEAGQLTFVLPNFTIHMSDYNHSYVDTSLEKNDPGGCRRKYESALRRFKRQVSKAGIFPDIKRQRHFETH